MFKNTWSCFEMFLKDLRINMLDLVIVPAFYHILSGIVMTLNSFNIYFDDLRYLQVGHVSNSACKVSFRSLLEEPKFSNFAICEQFWEQEKQLYFVHYSCCSELEDVLM